MPITKPREPLCHKPIPDELLANLATVVGEDGVECVLEDEHRGACILATETGTYILQVAWWKHNFPVLVPHAFVAGQGADSVKCSTCGHGDEHLVDGKRIHVAPSPVGPPRSVTGKNPRKRTVHVKRGR